MNFISENIFYETYDISKSQTIAIKHYEEEAFFLVMTTSNLATKAILNEIFACKEDKKSRDFLYHYINNSQILKNSGSFSGIILHFDYKGGFFSHINFDFPPVCFRDIHGKKVELKITNYKEGVNYQRSDIQDFDLNDISILFAATTQLGLLMFKNICPEAFSKKDLIVYIKELGESLLQKEGLFSFFILNCDIGRNIEYTRNYKIEPSLNRTREIESELEALMQNYFGDQNISAKASLILNELLLNAYEHGILGISSEEKHKKMEEGTYEEFLIQREKEVKGEIELDATFYTKGLLKIRIKDSGKGFNFENYIDDKSFSEKEFSGRGIKMSKNIANAIFFKDNGRDVTFFIKYNEKNIHKELPELTEKEVLSSCSALYVEDEPVIRSLFETFLKKRLKILYVAEDGLDGLEQFKKYKPDLVISDVSMPKMNGLEMIKAIKAISPSTPVILTTAHDYEANIYEAVQLGINKFLPKPIELEALRSALFSITKKIALKKLENKKEKELSLADLRAANKYQLNQHIKAGEKQKLLIHNDISNICCLKAHIFYKPLEFLSGDMYGIFKLSESTSLFYIIDCMDKGLVASVTSVLSSAFLIEKIKLFIKNNEFSLLKLVNSYEEYIEQYLLEDECISISFLKIDSENRSFEYIAHGMYPLFIKNKSSDEFVSIKAQNPPFMKGDRSKDVIKGALPENFIIVTYSDGACEFDGFSYKEFLEFAKTQSSFVSYESKIVALLGINNDGLKDDVTLIFIESKDKI